MGGVILGDLGGVTLDILGGVIVRVGEDLGKVKLVDFLPKPGELLAEEEDDLVEEDEDSKMAFLPATTPTSCCLVECRKLVFPRVKFFLSS